MRPLCRYNRIGRCRQNWPGMGTRSTALPSCHGSDVIQSGVPVHRRVARYPQSVVVRKLHLSDVELVGRPRPRQGRRLIDLASDTRSRSTQLGANLRLGQKLTIGPTVQWNDIEDRDNRSRDSRTLNTGLNLGYAFTQRLSGNLGYNLYRRKVADGSGEHPNTVHRRPTSLDDYTGARRPSRSRAVA